MASSIRSFALMAFIFFSYEANATGFRKILIDPGHGGVDRGASREQWVESTITLEISKLLQEELLSLGRTEVRLTRSKDQTVSLESRVDMAASWNPDLFLSLHLNSHLSPKAHGVEIYSYGQAAADQETLFLVHQEEERTKNITDPNQKKYEETKLIMEDLGRMLHAAISGTLAYKLMSQIKRAWSEDSVKALKAPFHVLVYAKSPSLLIEMGYLTSDVDLAWIKDPQTYRPRAKNLAELIVKEMEIIDKIKVGRHITAP